MLTLIISIPKAIRIIAVSIVVLICSSASAISQMLQNGEELTYSVSYLGIRLGTIRIVGEGKQDLNGKQVFKAKAYIDSRPGIPFVEIHTTFETWMDMSATASNQFVANTKDGEKWVYDKYTFDYAKKHIVAEQFVNNEKKLSKQFVINKKYSDGLSLFFVARQLLYAKNTAVIPTIVGYDTSRTKINFIGSVQGIDIDASSYPVRTVYFDGMADWVGVYGTTGGFEGWFSDDDARIPIKAKMKLYVGSASIELVSWRRADWQPPKAN